MPHLKPDEHSTAVSECLVMLQKVIDCIGGVDDVVGQPGLPCPAQSQEAVQAIRGLLRDYEDKHGLHDEGDAGGGHDAEQQKAVDNDAQSPLSIGAGPYTGMLVAASDGKCFYKTHSQYDTEAAALNDTLTEARRCGLRVDLECTRHWVTSKLEHMVDFGSHSIYARITSPQTVA